MLYVFLISLMRSTFPAHLILLFQSTTTMYFHYYPPIHSYVSLDAFYLTILDLATYVVSSTTHEAPHYVIFSSLPPLPYSYVQYSPQYFVFSNTLNLFLLLRQETKFRTRTKQQAK
jgi:hypothetical protein